ncbi:Transposon Tf2-6 polyprotein [Caligus rogercresseyi]|uniref:Transposon Tf2-6 polyprotein n=1 Tax=Caligus rogercresseyi TaxID=217165 RepID=A0A7T8K9G9_CALRO|nr:Transposon Tf2-6 polyprotein [Caligus rogercresseyi]
MFRYLRNAMGLISAGDEFNRRGDDAIAGIPNVKKIVEEYYHLHKDEILISSVSRRSSSAATSMVLPLGGELHHCRTERSLVRLPNLQRWLTGEPRLATPPPSSLYQEQD